MRLTIIPIAHISKTDPLKVSATIRKEKPDFVAVELDEGRMRSLKGVRTRPTNILHLLLWLFQNLLGKLFGAKAGAEMMAAVKTAEELHIPCIPIDQDIRKTLLGIRNAPWQEKLRTLLEIPLIPLMLIQIRTPDSLKKPATLKLLLKAFQKHYPIFYRILISERNSYMAGNLLSQKGRKGVVVVGAAHAFGLRGDLKRLSKKAGKKLQLKILWR